MRRGMLLLVSIALTVPVWGADPILGAWILNVAKSKFPPSAEAITKEKTVVFPEVADDMSEGSSASAGKDGSTTTAKWTVPGQGGIRKYQQGWPAAGR